MYSCLHLYRRRGEQGPKSTTSCQPPWASFQWSVNPFRRVRLYVYRVRSERYIGQVQVIIRNESNMYAEHRQVQDLRLRHSTEQWPIGANGVDIIIDVDVESLLPSKELLVRTCKSIPD